MTKLNELKAQYEELGKQIEEMEAKAAFKPGWYIANGEDATEYRLTFIDYKDRLDFMNTMYQTVEPVTAETLARFLPAKKTRYDWSKAPDWAKIAIINEHGTPFMGTYSNAVPEGCGWEGIGEGHWTLANSDFVIDATGDWRDSLERKPE